MHSITIIPHKVDSIAVSPHRSSIEFQTRHSGVVTKHISEPLELSHSDLSEQIEWGIQAHHLMHCTLSIKEV